MEKEQDIKINNKSEDKENFEDNNGDGVYTQPDYQGNYQIVNDTNGDCLDDYPDFEVDNRKVEMRIDYDPIEDFSMSFQTGYSFSKTIFACPVGAFKDIG